MSLQSSPYTGKEGKPTVAYQVTVNHSGRVLAPTEGFIGSTNDKTIICWDAAVDQIRKDKKYTDKYFDVYNEDGTTRTLKGCCLLVENGYHKINNCKVTHGTSFFYSRATCSISGSKKNPPCWPRPKMSSVVGWSWFHRCVSAPILVLLQRRGDEAV